MSWFVRGALLALPLLLATVSAHATGSGLRLRTVEGVDINITEQSHAEPTILVTFSTHDPTATATLRRAEKALRREGVRMVAVNVDGAHERTALKAWVRRSRLKAPVFADPDHQLQGHLAAAGTTTLLVDPTGKVVQRWEGWDSKVEAKALAAAEALPAPPPMEMSEKTPLIEASDWKPPMESLDGAGEDADPAEPGGEAPEPEEPPADAPPTDDGA